MNGYITAKELAARIGVDASAIRKRAARGTIERAMKIGGKQRGEWYIPVDVAETITRSTSGRKPPNK